MLAVGAIDLEHKIIPNKITYPALPEPSGRDERDQQDPGVQQRAHQRAGRVDALTDSPPDDDGDRGPQDISYIREVK